LQRPVVESLASLAPTIIGQSGTDVVRLVAMQNVGQKSASDNR